MSESGWRTTNDTISPVLKKLLSKTQNASGALARIYPVYQAAQIKRFETENESETGHWESLKPEYEAYKLIRYGGGPRHKWVGGRGDGRPWADAGSWNTYPGAGSKMLIGTSMLAGAVIGPGDHPFEGVDQHRATFTDRQMTIQVAEGGVNPDGSKFEYPHFVAEHRPFFTFGETTKHAMLDAVRKFILAKESE